MKINKEKSISLCLLILWAHSMSAQQEIVYEVAQDNDSTIGEQVVAWMFVLGAVYLYNAIFGDNKFLK